MDIIASAIAGSRCKERKRIVMQDTEPLGRVG